LADADARPDSAGVKSCSSQCGCSTKNKFTASHERFRDAKEQGEEVKALGVRYFYLLSRQWGRSNGRHMKPGARVATEIELLEELESLWGEGSRAPADGVLNQFFRHRRFIGSKDRGEISRVVYGVLRHEAALNWQLTRGGVEINPRGRVLAAHVLADGVGVEELQELCNGEQYCPARLSEAELGWVKSHAAQPLFHDDMPRAVKFHYPEWMESTLQELFGETLPEAMEAMNREAPVDIRVNTLKATRDELLKELASEGLEPEPTPHSTLGVRLKKRGPLIGMEIFRQGWFELQDEGSQLVAQLVQAQSGDKGVDFCAGAGGKTLALAAEMENRGRILAWDTDSKRLGQMKPRLGRAGVSNVQMRLLKSEHDNVVKRYCGTADWVLLDVPCTGTGTWRRSPDLRRRTTPRELEEAQELQRTIFENASGLVKPGGRLVYVTCSILPEENESQVEGFLHAHPQFKQADPFLRLYPHTEGTDGFFGAVLHKA